MKRKNAFTLIELLVVVAIIAVLVAILIPGLQKARERTYILACAGNMKTLLLGFQHYAMDYNDYLPRPPGDLENQVGYMISRVTPSNIGISALVTGKYVTEIRPFFCAADTVWMPLWDSWKTVPWEQIHSNIRCSYSYRLKYSTWDKWGYRSGIYNFRIGSGIQGSGKSPVAFFADAYTTSWDNFLYSHNIGANDPSGIFRNPPWPLGFNVGFDDGQVRWFYFRLGESSWGGAQKIYEWGNWVDPLWTPYPPKFFQLFDGCTW